MITIYKITNPAGGEYIGQTKNLTKRKHLYKIAHCKQQLMLYNSIKKYGWEQHTCEVIDTVPLEKADEAEIYNIQKFNTYWKDGNGMNLTRGGYRPAHTEETKKKLSEMFSGSKHGKAKKLYQYTLDGVFVREWHCMKDAERELNYKTTCLSIAAKNSNKTAYGYKWYYTPQHELIKGEQL